MRALSKYSPNAQVFCFMHKIDLMDEKFKEERFQIIIQDLSIEWRKPVKFHKTSVYDNSIISIFEEII